ncbi:MAG: CapA family protein [Candidatus Paceibacterota bacterium]
MKRRPIQLILVLILASVIGLGLALYANQSLHIKNPPSVSTSSQSAPKATSTTITFVGDMMLDRYIRAQAEIHGYDHILAEVKDQLLAVDMVVGNLEGPITSQSSVSTYDPQDPNHYRFTFAPLVADLLTEHNIGLVSIGNNHIENFGRGGVDETTKFLDIAGISYVGHPYNDENLSFVKQINGQQFSFVSFNYADDRPASKTQQQIEALKDRNDAPDWIIVLAHWGREYEQSASPAQVETARSFVDTGADLVIGTHPHVIQNRETYRDVLIYYSLGNFVFDQYFSPAVRCGLMLSVRFDSTSSIETTENFVELIEDGSTQPADCRNAATEKEQ